MTIATNQNIGWLEISVNDLGWMQILHALDKLIEYVSVVDVFEDFLPDGIMQICLHELKN